MAAPFTSSIPRFRVTFNLASAANTISVYDLINTGYSAYGTTTNFKGLLKITDPDNIIIYQNAGWSLTAPDFTSPDINGNTPTWTKSSIALPTAVKLGTYTFMYIASIDATGDPTRTTFVTVTKTYDYQWATPVVEIDYTLSCRTSEITSTDSTDYAVTISNVTYTPTTTRTHTLIKPAGAGCNSPAAVSTATITWGAGGTAATDLWTNVWQTTISTLAVYNLETWSGDNWFVVSATITGSDSIDVQCSDCVCELRTCIDNLIDDWKSTIGTNFKREAELRTKVLKILAAWSNYEWAERCGYSTDEYCEEIKDIASSEDCDCNTSTDTASTRVVAWGNGTGQSSASTFAYTVSAADPTGGNTGDMHYNTTSYHVWRKDSAWVDYGSVRGATGAAGAAGTNESILDHSSADSATTATTARETLYSYSMTAASVAASGDILEITMNFLLGSNANGKTLYLKWGGTDLLTFFTDSLVNTSNNVVKLKAWITRTGTATQDIELFAQRSGYPPSHISYTTGTEDFTGAIVIYADAQNSTASASDITLKEFKAELHNVI